jgi:O-antigen/teichoic acid export membrane protein
VIGGGVLVFVGVTRRDFRSAWLFAAIAAFMSILQAVPSAVLMGLQRWRAATGVGLASGVVGTATTVAVLIAIAQSTPAGPARAARGIPAMFVIEAVIATVNLAGTGILARRRLAAIAPRAGAAGDLPKRVAAYAAKLSVNVVLGFVVWRRTEFFFLKHYSSDAQIAFYSIAFAFVAALSSIYEAMSAVLAPAIATLFGAGSMDRIRTGSSRAFRLVMMLTMPAVAGSLALGPAMVRSIWGGAYAGAGVPLLIVVGTLLIVPLRTVGGAILIGIGHLRFQLWAAAVATVVNISMDFAVIPHYGARGAAVANSLAQVTYASIIFVGAYRATGVALRVATLVRGALAAAIAGIVSWITYSLVGGSLGVLCGATAGVVSYAVAAIAMRIVPPDDVAWLQESAGHRLGGLVGRACRLLA